MFLPLAAVAQTAQDPDSAAITGKAANDFAIPNSTLALSPDKFIENPQSFISEISNIPGAKINTDSLYELPPAEIRKLSQLANQRPTIVETGVIKLKKSDTHLMVASFDPVFNLIRLKVLEIDDEYLSFGVPGEDVGKLLDQKQYAQAQVDAMNAELLYQYVHEEDHSRKYRLQYDASMTVSQILQFKFHLELSARIAVNLARWKILRATGGDLSSAYPRYFYMFCEENKFQRGGKTYDALKTPGFWRNDEKLKKTVIKNWDDLPGSLLYAFGRDNLDSPIDDEKTDLVVRDAISDFDKEAELYKAQARDDMQNTVAIILSEQYLSKNARAAGPKDFDALIRDAYSFNIDGKIQNILDLVGAETTAVLLDKVRSYVSDAQIASQAKAIRQPLETLIKLGENARLTYGIAPENSKYDTDNLYKTTQNLAAAREAVAQRQQ